jgi:hypothetical protein
MPNHAKGALGADVNSGVSRGSARVEQKTG